MNRLLILIAALALFNGSEAQNVGIGITTPRSKLHVFTGSSGNLTPYAPVVIEGDGNTYMNILSPNANETGIFFGNTSNAASGGIVYNNTGTPNGLQFRTAGNQTRMVISSLGNVGIGNLNPGAPLSFSSVPGKKIMLFPGASGISGFSIENNTLQIHTHDINGDISFGYDLFNNINESFRIKATGAFVFGGNSGTAGQVLQSNGTARPSWTNPSNFLYNNTVMLQSFGTVLISGSTPIPGMTHSFTVNTTSKVLINFAITAHPPSCFVCGTTTLVVSILLDGAFIKSYYQDIPNDSDHILSGTFLINVAPGSHTISFTANRIGPDVTLGYSGANVATLQIIPQ